MEIILTTLQIPLKNSAFGEASTAQEVIKGINLKGKTIIVTGGYSGLGKETTKTFISAGAEVIVPARDIKRAREALSEIDGVQIEYMDLTDPVSIDSFTNKFLSTHNSLHILVNCAAIMLGPFDIDARGNEKQFSTNHLGHFQLTINLLPALRNAKKSRVVNVSSLGHHYSPVQFEDINFKNRPYEPWSAYGQSKTANILFSLALNEKEKINGVEAFSLHPGSIVTTNLGKHLNQEDFYNFGLTDEKGTPINDPSKQIKNKEQGAATIVWCATSPLLTNHGGVYCENCNIAGIKTEDALKIEEITSTAKFFGVMPYAVDLSNADRLWDLSNKLIFG